MRVHWARSDAAQGKQSSPRGISIEPYCMRSILNGSRGVAPKPGAPRDVPSLRGGRSTKLWQSMPAQREEMYLGQITTKKRHVVVPDYHSNSADKSLWAIPGKSLRLKTEKPRNSCTVSIAGEDVQGTEINFAQDRHPATYTKRSKIVQCSQICYV